MFLLFSSLFFYRFRVKHICVETITRLSDERARAFRCIWVSQLLTIDIHAFYFDTSSRNNDGDGINTIQLNISVSSVVVIISPQTSVSNTRLRDTQRKRFFRKVSSFPPPFPSLLWKNRLCLRLRQVLFWVCIKTWLKFFPWLREAVASNWTKDRHTSYPDVYLVVSLR